MPLTIARFDLVETVPIPNVPQPRSGRREILPAGFPFVVEEDEQEVVEPILLFLADKYTVPAAFVSGEWTKNNSASAAAADLKDWWAMVHDADVPWDCADASLVADWLMDMRMSVSGKTGDFLNDRTIRRRASNVAEFYRWALARKLVETVPEPDAARRLAELRLANPDMAWARRTTRKGKYDRDPRPIPPERTGEIADALGPLPSMNLGRPSRSRLAFELGYETGMRIDEILHLPSELFAGFDFDESRPFAMTTIDVEHTKGLVPREVNVPAWLMNELSIYVDGERENALRAARRHWLDASRKDPWQLLLNHPGSTQHVGKPTRAATVQDEFHAVCMRLNITRRKVLAKGTDQMKVVKVPKHGCSASAAGSASARRQRGTSIFLRAAVHRGRAHGQAWT